MKKSEVCGVCGTYGGDESFMQEFSEETSRKGPLGRPKNRLKKSIKMCLQGIGWGSMGWIDLTQDRDKWWAVVNVVMNYHVSKNARNLLTGFEMTSFSWWTALLYGVCLSGIRCGRWSSNNFLCIFYVLHACYMSSPVYSPWFESYEF